MGGTSLIVMGVLGLIVVGLIAWFAVWIVKRSNAKYARLWGEIADLVDGTSKSAKLSGSYQAMPVLAQVNTSTDSDNRTTHSYDLSLTTGTGGADWSLQHTGDKLLGFGAKAWRVKTKDQTLADRLVEAGATAAMDQWDAAASIVYKAKKGSLTYHMPVRGAFAVPGREQFKAQLDLLVRLAEINRQVNAGRDRVVETGQPVVGS